MKVLFQARFDLFDKRGGDTVQVEKTAEELRKRGVLVDFNNSYKLDLDGYDLVHIFGLDWSCEPYLQAMNAKAQNKKVVLSAIHHSEMEVLRYEKLARYSFRRFANLVCSSQESKDVIKNVYRSVFDSRKRYPTLLSIKHGFRNQQREVLRLSDMVLTQTNKEAVDIRQDFGVLGEWRKIVLGVSEAFMTPRYEKFFDFDDYILTVGRIEPRKNQLNVIKAVKELVSEGMDLKLVVVGALSSNNFEYNYHFKKEVKDNKFITHIPFISNEKLPSVFRQSKVCVSASWFETTGLTLLEAYVSGANLVAPSGSTGERVKEYLGNIPFFCDQADISSIKDAIKKAYFSPRPAIDENLRGLYTWSRVADETIKVYNELLDK